MDGVGVLVDGFGRVGDLVHGVLDGLGEDELTARLGPEANTIAWLVWHLARVEDAQVAHLAGTDQVWHAQGFADRFALPFDRDATGYGQSPEQVAQVRAEPALLAAYADATRAATDAYLARLQDEDLARVVDERWDPPVTVGVRLVSVLGDVLEHAGQAAFVRGVVTSR
ncbi:mycothiol transferase [Cellulomonas hominis]|uniref:mycothiol transferase n=1 Tax=Cellulomonas hominis TaxID=156981 RepID=UPI0030B85C48